LWGSLVFGLPSGASAQRAESTLSTTPGSTALLSTASAAHALEPPIIDGLDSDVIWRSAPLFSEGRGNLMLRSSTCPVAKIQHRHHDHIQSERCKEAAENDDRHRALNLVSGLSTRQSERYQSEPCGQRRHHNRA
jgi:hypothetical protein